jgi:hypothetical protein
MKFSLKHFSFALFAAGSLLFAGCASEPSADVNQDSIYARYVLEYNADTDKTYARAQFRFGNATGTILELSAPATVKFNGDVLTWNATLAYYEKEYAGLVSTGTFSYNDLDNNTFNNSASVPSVTTIPTSLTSISISGAYTYSWSGPALLADENIWVHLDGYNTTGSAQTFTTYTDNATSIIFPLNQLQATGTGTSTIYMDRVIETAPTQATSKGGIVVGRYKADPKTITITN